jgi:flavin-dependent dehydrogenase
MLNRVHITGGGLAGLSLGIALRRADVPVTLFEAGSYPRHRVCGEFVSGLTVPEWSELGLADVIAKAVRHDDAAWFCRDKIACIVRLPEPALAMSRYDLDAALAGKFCSSGGELRCGDRLSPVPSGEGWVIASGRARGRPRWLGLKAHYHGLDLAAGLEMHLGTSGYAGLARVGNDRVNVCALLKATRAAGGSRHDALPRRLREVGLVALAARLERAEVVSASVTGVTHFNCGWHRKPANELALGDRAAMIAPFTGNGMSMAFQSALAAAPWITAWARGDIGWTSATVAVGAELKRRFRRRMNWAAVLHPLLLNPGSQAVLRGMAGSRLLPFEWLFRRLR